MFDRILLPTDGSEAVQPAIEQALALAETYDASLYVLHVVETAGIPARVAKDELFDALESEGREAIENIHKQASRADIPHVEGSIANGTPYRAILKRADEHDVDLIVMGTHGRTGVERQLLGSTTERVMRRADAPVLTVQADEATTHPYRNVLVPTDGSDCATDALELGIDVAGANGASLHLLTVVDRGDFGINLRSDERTTEVNAAATDVVDDATAVAERAGIESVSGTIETGTSIHQAIRSYVEENDVDLVVLGTHGRTGVDRYMLGSVTEKFVRTSPVPVLTARKTPTES
ncbi:universal stress protein [Halococcus thailandensis]|uniref:UspA domain-containing protein n=1 Tax=Halococcus thailandensis JCM 13552 TaxID=1227457 RepID=M0NHN0_9EURY|nr:universal stress protein [Halococcus thailandensis]EMA56160.1 UspA domain-containing protein [Halococcus thailandensis JCM 13552]